MRADAARNRKRVLDAARTLFTRQGLDVSMDSVARTAGVGVGTVYRHFPDRDALVTAVLADRIEHVTAIVDAARRGLAGDDPEQAWHTFLTAMIDSGMLSLIPLVAPRAQDTTVFSDEMIAARARGAGGAEEVINTAQRMGFVRDDIGAPELALLLASAARRFPGLPPDLDAALAARRIPLVLSALRPGGDPLPGAPTRMADLWPRSARSRPPDLGPASSLRCPKPSRRHPPRRPTVDP